jgi:hypothetical protein
MGEKMCRHTEFRKHKKEGQINKEGKKKKIKNA